MSDKENLEFDEFYNSGINRDENEIEKKFPYINAPNLTRTLIEDIYESISEITYHVNSFELDNNFIQLIDDDFEEESEEEEEGPYFDLYVPISIEPTINLEN